MMENKIKKSKNKKCKCPNNNNKRAQIQMLSIRLCVKFPKIKAVLTKWLKWHKSIINGNKIKKMGVN
jgi:hypothetical protein